MTLTHGKCLARLLLAFSVLFLLWPRVLCSQPEDLEGGEGLVKLVDKTEPAAEDGAESEAKEEVVKLEGADLLEEASEVQNPEHVYEACASLQESFKECEQRSVNQDLRKLVEVCNSSVYQINRVVSVANDIVQSLNNPDISELNECSAMVFTSSMFISSATALNSEEDEAGSLEVESLETDSSHLDSESDET